jgi:hypothetical protein
VRTTQLFGFRGIRIFFAQQRKVSIDGKKPSKILKRFFTACHNTVSKEKVGHKGLQEKCDRQPERIFDNPHISRGDVAPGPKAKISIP